MELTFGSEGSSQLCLRLHGGMLGVRRKRKFCWEEEGTYGCWLGIWLKFPTIHKFPLLLLLLFLVLIISFCFGLLVLCLFSVLRVMSLILLSILSVCWAVWSLPLLMRGQLKCTISISNFYSLLRNTSSQTLQVRRVTQNQPTEIDFKIPTTVTYNSELCNWAGYTVD